MAKQVSKKSVRIEFPRKVIHCTVEEIAEIDDWNNIRLFIDSLGVDFEGAELFIVPVINGERSEVIGEGDWNSVLRYVSGIHMNKFTRRKMKFRLKMEGKEDKIELVTARGEESARLILEKSNPDWEIILEQDNVPRK